MKSFFKQIHQTTNENNSKFSDAHISFSLSSLFHRSRYVTDMY